MNHKNFLKKFVPEKFILKITSENLTYVKLFVKKYQKDYIGYHSDWDWDRKDRYLCYSQLEEQLYVVPDRVKINDLDYKEINTEQLKTLI